MDKKASKVLNDIDKLLAEKNYKKAQVSLSSVLKTYQTDADLIGHDQISKIIKITYSEETKEFGVYKKTQHFNYTDSKEQTDNRIIAFNNVSRDAKEVCDIIISNGYTVRKQWE